MRIPLASYGRTEIAKGLIAAIVGGGVSVWIGLFAGWQVGGPLLGFWAICFAYVLVFFRDFDRTSPSDAGLLVAPADGTVTDIGTVTEPEFVDGPALKIGIFMSLVSCHVNRAPCDGHVAWLEHRPGVYLDARSPDSAVRNESQWIGLDTSHGRVLVRQITGKVARRIVCALRDGMRIARGERIGMIKFGSRTEVYVPVSAGFTPSVQVGDKVFGGITVLAHADTSAPAAVPAPAAEQVA